MTRIALDASFKPTSRTMTPEGYLCVQGIAARTGVYQYLSSELGLEGPERMVGVYRPPEQVFSPESLASYPDSDMTNDHPNDLVNSKTFREHSVGHVRGAMQDGDNVVVDMIIKDQTAIDDVMSGKAELSPGYLAEYVKKAGVDPVSGAPYEFEQHDIVINHVAVVEAARAGKEARIFDSKPKGNVTMTQRKVVLDSKRKLSVTLDEDAAVIVEDALKHFKDEAEEANKKADAAEAKADAAEEKAEEAEKKTSDSAINARVQAVFATLDAARKLVPAYDSKGKTDALAIKREVMITLKPNRAWADKSAAYVEAAFDEATEAKEDEDEKDDKKDMTSDARSTLDTLSKDVQAFQDARSQMDGSKSYQQFLSGGAK